MNVITRNFGGKLIAVVMVVLLVVYGPVPTLAAGVDDEEPIFYPEPPNMPRIQYLKTFSSALDLETENKGFRDFVFGGSENETKLLTKPFGLAVKDGAIYAVDTRGYGYAVFDVATNKSRFVAPGGSGKLKKPINITIDDDGTRYVTDTKRNQVVVFSENDRFIRALGSSGQFKPADVAIAGDRLFVSDLDHHQIVILDKASGEELGRFGGGGSDPGKFLHPSNLAIGPSGSLFVSDTNNFRIQEFDLDGKLIRTMGQAGTSPGTFSRPKGLDVDRNGYLYVVDAAFNNIQVLAPEDGGAVMAFGKLSDRPDSINMPSVIKIDYDNVEYFQRYAAEGFELEYLIFVTSQFGENKVTVFGYGQLQD
jgi:sugar lactone lactonase YvrE